MTMMWGYHYNRGKRVGYNITFGNFTLHEVSSADKARIIREIKQSGYTNDQITVEREEIS